MSGIGQGTPPGTQWLQQQKRRRDNPDDMFTNDQNLARNKAWAKPGPYITKLTPQEEQGYRQWFEGLKTQYGDKMVRL